MKTIKILLTSIVMMAVLTVSATRITESTSPESTEVKQCGVSNAQISTYLRTCSHQHVVYWVQDIPGTCNSKAGIEGCSTATVFVSEGTIVGHADNSGYCD